MKELVILLSTLKALRVSLRVVPVVLEFHVICLRYRGQGVEMIGETARVHQDALSTRFTAAQGKRFYWEAGRVAGQKGLVGFADPVAEHEVSVIPTNFLQCLVDAGNKEIVPDSRASVAILGCTVS